MQRSPLQQEQHVIVAVDGPIARLTLNRPAKRNALNVAVARQLQDAVDGLPESVKAIVLDAAGEHFSAGLDLSEIQTSTTAEGVAHSRKFYEAFGRIQFGRVPVVAVLHGAVVGAGLELASAAHVRVAEKSAYFGLPEGQRGIFLGGGGSVRIPKLIGFSRVTEMMLTGHVYSAEEGLQIGLVHHLVRDGDGLAKAYELARKVAANAPLSNFAIMHALPLIAEQSMEHGLLTESLMAAITTGTEEAKSRVADFLEKRAAKVERL